jgi:hypothetical protein
MSADNYYAMLQQTNNQGMITINYGYARYGTGPNPASTAAHLAADWVNVIMAELNIGRSAMKISVIGKRLSNQPGYKSGWSTTICQRARIRSAFQDLRRFNEKGCTTNW